MINLNIPNISNDDVSSIIGCLESGWISSAGPDIQEFEKQFGAAVNSKFSVACSSGTSALHVSLHLKNINEDSDVLLPALSFIASANAVRYCNGNPIFIDVQPADLGFNFDIAEEYIEQNYYLGDEKYINKNSQNTLKAIVPVHLLGCPIDISRLEDFAKKYHLEIIMDSAEALGSKYKNNYIGSENFLNCFSFNGNKIITTGGGGMITASSEEDAKYLRHITTTAKTDNTFFIHDKVGFNYRLINLLASLGISQLKKIRQFVDIKRNIQQIYFNELTCDDIEVFCEPSLRQSNYWLNMISFSERIMNKISLNELVDHFRENNIEVRQLCSIIPELEPYKKYERSSLINTFNIWNKSLCIPSSTNLSPTEQEKVILATKKVLDVRLKI